MVGVRGGIGWRMEGRSFGGSALRLKNDRKLWNIITDEKRKIMNCDEDDEKDKNGVMR